MKNVHPPLWVPDPDNTSSIIYSFSGVALDKETTNGKYAWAIPVEELDKAVSGFDAKAVALDGFAQPDGGDFAKERCEVK